MNVIFAHLQKTLNTTLIVPEIFQNLKILGVFSQKLPKDFKFSLLFSQNLVQWFFPTQVHGTEILNLDEFKETPKSFTFFADAVITSKPKIFVGIRTADCVPILIATKSNTYIGAVHAGWKGSVNKILEKTLKILHALGIEKRDLLVAIGPHIKACCYQIGNEVIAFLIKNFTNYEEFIIKNEKGLFLDLEKLNLFQALSFGVPLENIWISRDCTFCRSDVYWSYRAHKEKRGEQISFIGKIL